LEQSKRASGVRLPLEYVNDHASRIPNVESRPVAGLDENDAIEPSDHPDRRILRDTIRNVADGEDEPLLVSEVLHAL
jgi:hypothetical protein